jgi:TatD DNase family protein
MYVDSHAHLTSDALFPQVEGLLERAKSSKITHIVNICTDISTLERGIELNKKYPWLVNAASTTPHDVDLLGESDFERMKKAATDGLLVAIGETGLDYHYSHSKPENQKAFLIRYARLAKSLNLPLVIHCREAFEDLFTFLDQEEQKKVLLHCFTGTLDEAKEVIKRGWMLSLSGIVTFKKSIDLQEVAKWVPIENLLIETDAPYLSPQSKRGKTNEPSFLPETAAFIANLKSLPAEELGEKTSQNAMNFFRLKP